MILAGGGGSRPPVALNPGLLRLQVLVTFAPCLMTSTGESRRSSAVCASQTGSGSTQKLINDIGWRQQDNIDGAVVVVFPSLPPEERPPAPPLTTRLKESNCWYHSAA